MPTLRPGDVVVIDNLGSHKSASVHRANPHRRSHGSSCYAECSPHLILIDKLFAMRTHWLRRAAFRALDADCDAIDHVLATGTASKFSNYLIPA